MARKKKQRRDNHLNDRADQTQKLLAVTLRMQARTLALLEHGEPRRKDPAPTTELTMRPSHVQESPGGAWC